MSSTTRSARCQAQCSLCLRGHINRERALTGSNPVVISCLAFHRSSRAMFLMFPTGVEPWEVYYSRTVDDCGVTILGRVRGALKKFAIFLVILSLFGRETSGRRRRYLCAVLKNCHQARRNGRTRTAQARGQPREEDTLGAEAAQGGGGDADQARGAKPRSSGEDKCGEAQPAANSHYPNHPLSEYPFVAVAGGWVPTTTRCLLSRPACCNRLQTKHVVSAGNQMHALCCPPHPPPLLPCTQKAFEHAVLLEKRQRFFLTVVAAINSAIRWRNNWKERKWKLAKFAEALASVEEKARQSHAASWWSTTPLRLPSFLVLAAARRPRSRSSHSRG